MNQTLNNRIYPNHNNTNNIGRNDYLNRNTSNPSALNSNQNYIRNLQEEHKDFNKMKKLQINFYKDDIAMNLSFKNVFLSFF